MNDVQHRESTEFSSGTLRDTFLVGNAHVPQKAKFQVIDAHNHLWGDWRTVDRLIDSMDRVGVSAYCDLTANISLTWGEGNYELGPGDLDQFIERVVGPYPGRFFFFTAATFSQPVSCPLFSDADRFVAETLEMLHCHVEKGARGLKVLKELGLHYRDGEGNLIFIDDERLSPIWETAGELGIPVLTHQSDPCGFFEPISPANEHFSTLKKFPGWSFADPKYPRKDELIRHRDALLRNHPDTLFILPHVGNYAEDLGYVGRLLDENPNAYIDISARMDELGRQPYTARSFMIDYQDRILFGTDMPVSDKMYRSYFRFLETWDEGIVPPDYDGTFDRYRWRVCGLGLPDEVLEKIYYKNALTIIPGLKEKQ